jgi:hypothetical protein
MYGIPLALKIPGLSQCFPEVGLHMVEIVLIGGPLV